VLQGKRAQGYVRLSSPTKISCQIRWQTESKPDLTRSLKTYFDRLRHDAKKAKQDFVEQIDPAEDRILYRWKGVGQGRGVLMVEGGRIFFLEVAGERKDSLKPHVDAIAEGFSVSDNAREHWSVLGLDVSLPAGMEIVKHQFLTGRTKLDLQTKGLSIQVERWGLGSQLMAKHDLATWTQNLWKMPNNSTLDELDGSVRWSSRSILKNRWALSRFEPDRNQIQTLHVTARHDRWRPEWDWLH